MYSLPILKGKKKKGFFFYYYSRITRRFNVATYRKLASLHTKTMNEPSPDPLLRLLRKVHRAEHERRRRGHNIETIRKKKELRYSFEAKGPGPVVHTT